MTKKNRSEIWLGEAGVTGFFHRTHLKSQGHLEEMFDGRPVIGIASSASDLVPCNAHLSDLGEWVVRGVLEAGGFPLVFPTMSIGDSIIRPTGMMYRNLMSMDLEETAHGNPVDGLVLLTGCDNTAPAYLMGAASVDLPSIVVHGGPMISGHVAGQTVGSGTDIYHLYDDTRADGISHDAFRSAEFGMSRSIGHCNTMGTASTMGAVAEALGLCLPGSAGIPAVDSRKKASAQMAGRRIVEMIAEELSFSKVVTMAAMENAIRVNSAIGGGTNTSVHLLALAGRLNLPVKLETIEKNSRDIPLMASVMPNGNWLMEEFYHAGGLPALMGEMGDLLNMDALTVSGKTLGQTIGECRSSNKAVIATKDTPINSRPALAVLTGNLAPNGAIIKPTAATPELMQHIGRAVVFDGQADYDARIDDPDLEITADSVVVVRGIGPCAYPGMPELGNAKIPEKLVKQGVRDMVRISDGRMSGTAFGTVVLHVSPEAAAGGPLAAVRDGDMIELDVENRRIHLDVSDKEIALRLEDYEPPESGPSRGYKKLFQQSVQQADKGLDFEFLQGKNDPKVPLKKPF